MPTEKLYCTFCAPCGCISLSRLLPMMTYRCSSPRADCCTHYFLLWLLFSSNAAASCLARSSVLTWIIHVSKPSPFSFDVVSLTYFFVGSYFRSGRRPRFRATCPLGSALKSNLTELVSLCFKTRNGPTPFVDHGLLALSDFSSESDCSLAGTNFNTFARTSCTTSSSASAPSVKLICSCFSPSSSFPSLFPSFCADGSGVPAAGVVARLEPPPRFKGESISDALAARFSDSEMETYWSRWSRSHQLAVVGKRELLGSHQR